MREWAECMCNYYDELTDALQMPRRGLWWMNPPYGREIGAWVRYAKIWRFEESGVCLLPARTDTRWWHNNIPHASQVVFIKGRLKFGEAINSAPFPSEFVVFGDINQEQREKLASYGISYEVQP